MAGKAKRVRLQIKGERVIITGYRQASRSGFLRTGKLESDTESWRDEMRRQGNLEILGLRPGPELPY